MTQHIFSARHREEKHHVSFKRSIHDHDVCLGGTTRPSQRDISRGKKRRDINPSLSTKESTNNISFVIDGVGRDRRSISITLWRRATLLDETSQARRARRSCE
jgi:hypothetical protein